MFEIQKENTITLNRVINAYSDMMDTMLPYPIVYIHGGYVPSLFDVAGRFYDEGPFEDAAFTVLRYCDQYKIFLKHNYQYINFPSREVW
jgi:hypothetical protein